MIAKSVIASSYLVKDALATLPSTELSDSGVESEEHGSSSFEYQFVVDRKALSQYAGVSVIDNLSLRGLGAGVSIVDVPGIFCKINFCKMNLFC